MVATPADFDGRPPAPRGMAPTLGQHTREVLGELGYAPADVEALVADGVAVSPGDAPAPAGG